MIKCLHSRVSRWKVNRGENADTAPNLRPSLHPPHPSVHPIIGALSERECMSVEGCASVCMHLLCMCVSMCACSAVPPVVEGKRHSTLSAGRHLLLRGTAQPDCAVSTNVCSVMLSAPVCVSFGCLWTCPPRQFWTGRLQYLWY